MQHYKVSAEQKQQKTHNDIKSKVLGFGGISYICQ